MTQRSIGLVTGAAGQLGRALAARAPVGWRCLACDSAALDVTNADQVRELLAREQPAVVINAAAFTAVDAAEVEVERAHAVNARGAENVALASAAVGARVIQVSTDFIFDGTRGMPYRPGDTPAPLGVYGRSKLDGERAVRRAMAGSLVVRTAWLYASLGRNFALTMLRLMRERDALEVVDDQIGTPTWASGLADALWYAAARPEVTGIHHWTDAGVASWYDFAVAIQEEARALGLLERSIPIRPIPTSAYPTAATRPAFSVLDKRESWPVLGGEPPHWRTSLRTMLAELARG